MKNEKIDMSRETDTFRVSQEGMYIITGTNSRHGITVSAGVRATIVLQDANLCDLENMGVAFHIAEDCHITVILKETICYTVAVKWLQSNQERLPS